MTATVHQPTPKELAAGAARALAGATLLALPMLMTMEMWWLATTLHPWRIAALVAIDLPLLVLLVRYLGFRDADGLDLADHVADALVAFGIGALTAAAFLYALGVTDTSRILPEVVRLVAAQTVPCSIGAAIARSQFAGGGTTLRGESASYPYELLLMALGALVFAFNIAPTEEVVLLATIVTPLEAAGLAVLSVVGLHALVYMLGFRGQHRSDAPVWSVFMGYSLAGYAVVLLVALALLWCFGRTGMPWDVVLVETVLLAVPGTVGAGAARLLL